MGASASKKSKKEPFLGTSKKGGDDGCIGNRKVRTILLSILLIIFFAMGLSYYFNQQDFFNSWSDSIFGFTCGDYCEDAANAWMIIIVGSICCIASAIFAILLFFINCDDKIGRIAGVGLIIGGLLYIIGWIWYTNLYHDTIPWDVLNDETKERVNAMLASWIGEALLPSITSILLGIDVFIHFFDNEFKRLLFNFLNLLIVSILCAPTYYLNSDNSDVDSIVSGIINSDAYSIIATGYLIIFWITLIYIILYICTCCTCNCKDSAIIRIILALGLIIGGISCSIGYYIYASDFNTYNSHAILYHVLYYIGYTILIGGCCIAWALDIALDVIKGNYCVQHNTCQVCRRLAAP